MPNDTKNQKIKEPEASSQNPYSSSLNTKSKLETSGSGTSQSQPIKWILFTFLIAGLGLLSESVYEKFIPSVEQIEMQSQNHFVSKDLYEMYKKGQIPKSFFQLKDIKWSYYDETLKTQIPPESIPFKTSVGGVYKLEIDAFSAPRDDMKIAIIQMNLIEIKTGNKVWELSRNYEVKNSK